MKYTHKKMTDSDGIEYEEVDYKTYVKSTSKHKLIQVLENRYFVEVNK